MISDFTFYCTFFPIVYLLFGILIGNIGKLYHHSKFLRVLEMLFWPIFAIIFILYGLCMLVLGVFHDEEDEELITFTDDELFSYKDKK